MSDSKYQAPPPAFTAHQPTPPLASDPHYYQGQTDAPLPAYHAPGNMASQGGYQQPAHHEGQYIHATPLTSLGRGPAPVDCPMCGRRALTTTTLHSGNFTHLWAALACFTMCLGCLPYLVTGLKDVNHMCGNCGALLAIWHRSGGGVDVMAHQMR